VKVIDRISTPIDYDCRKCKFVTFDSGVYFCSFHSSYYSSLNSLLEYNLKYNSKTKMAPIQRQLIIGNKVIDRNFIICYDYEENESN